MTRLSEKLYDLLPQVYRLRDEQLPGDKRPLADLLELIGREVSHLEENLEQLYDDQFIETCAEWVLPYIGDLIGYRELHGGPEFSSPRAEVANTIAYRRRKGTAAVLEQLARDVTGWDARAVEFFQRLIVSQHMNHIRPDCTFAPDLRNWENMEHVGTAFDALSHSIEVRRIQCCGGRYNIPNVGIFLWRRREWPLTKVPAYGKGDHRYFFNPMGFNSALVNLPVREDDITHIAEPINTPFSISRRRLHEDLQSGQTQIYGRSFVIWRDGEEVPEGSVAACCLVDDPGDPTQWAYQLSEKIAVDPELGRIAFPSGGELANPTDVEVTFHYAFPAELGGGEYQRADSIDLTLTPQIEVPGDHDELADALTAAGGSGAVEIGDSGYYLCPPSIAVAANQNLELRAADTKRPVLELDQSLEITGGEKSTMTLSGLVIFGNSVRIPKNGNELEKLRLLHCTLVPGLSLDDAGVAESPSEPSLVVELDSLELEIDRCILGGLRIEPGCRVHITNSAVDALGESNVAYAAGDGTSSGGQLRIENSTVIGRVLTKNLAYASNTIFAADSEVEAEPAVRSDQKQSGCTRFSYVPYGSEVPRQFQCQPSQTVRDQIAEAEKDNPQLSTSEKEAIAQSVRNRIMPVFVSRHYGTPAYLQLASSCPPVIGSGADDESEMGCYHMLYQPQREANLRLRLDEYLRVGLRAGIFFET